MAFLQCQINVLQYRAGIEIKFKLAYFNQHGLFDFDAMQKSLIKHPLISQTSNNLQHNENDLPIHSNGLRSNHERAQHEKNITPKSSISYRTVNTAFSCVIKAWRAHEGELRGYLTHRLGNTQPADDLLQEVFIKAMRQGAGFCNLDNSRAWLFQVARNALVDYQRLHRETAELPDDIPDSYEQTEPLVALGECIGRVLTELSPADRDIIEQCDLNGMKQQAYAEANDLTLPAVKSRLLRARQKMRETLSSNCQVHFDADGHVDGHVPRK